MKKIVFKVLAVIALTAIQISLFAQNQRIVLNNNYVEKNSVDLISDSHNFTPRNIPKQPKSTEC
jgi:uncharacterized membrane protein YciS (DUF1049 family)